MRTDMKYIDSLGGRGFEKYIYKLYNSDPFYRAKLTPASHDFGFDVIVITKDGNTHGIQCKWTSGNSIGYRAVEEAISAKSYYKTTDATVLTNGLFTAHAQKGAKRTGVRLNNRDDLIHMPDEYYGNIIKYSENHKFYPITIKLSKNDYFLLKAIGKIENDNNINDTLFILLARFFNRISTEKKREKCLDIYNSMLEPKLKR